MARLYAGIEVAELPNQRRGVTYFTKTLRWQKIAWGDDA
jgi:hypothetical protein